MNNYLECIALARGTTIAQVAEDFAAIFARPLALNDAPFPPAVGHQRGDIDEAAVNHPFTFEKLQDALKKIERGAHGADRVTVLA